MKKPFSADAAGWMYGLIHFSLEAACFYFLFSRLSASPLWWALAMLYDAIAFVPQSFFGILLDRFPRLDAGTIGCVVVLAALLLPWDIPALLLIGLGNALVHIAGAQKTLCGSGGQIAPCGIFVGGGSFGVITGQLLGLAGSGYLLLIPLTLMLFSTVLAFLAAKGNTPRQEMTDLSIDSPRTDSVIVLLSFAAVAVRAYIGYAIPTEWNKTAFQAVLLFTFMGMGKMLGGVLADRIGYRKTTFLSLLLGLPFLLFGNRIMLLSLIGVGLFSMTMPITIGILVSRFPKMPCFSFGVTTVALFAGTLPAFFIRPGSLLAHQIVVLILSILALVSILGCLMKGA